MDFKAWPGDSDSTVLLVTPRIFPGPGSSTCLASLRPRPGKFKACRTVSRYVSLPRSGPAALPAGPRESATARITRRCEPRQVGSDRVPYGPPGMIARGSDSLTGSRIGVRSPASESAHCQVLFLYCQIRG
eukprot:244997-Hanusia_phi.AAC.1